MSTARPARGACLAVLLLTAAAAADDPAAPRAQPEAGDMVGARTPRLTLRLAPGAPRDAEVSRDGTVLGGISLGIALPVDPGPHTIVVRAKGHADATTTVTLSEDERKELILEAGSVQQAAKPTVVEVPPSREVDPAAAHARPGLGTRRTLAVVSASAGGAALVVGTIFGASTILTWGAAETDCANGCTPGSKAQSERSQALTQATVSTAAFLAGAVLVVGGAALWLTAPDTKESKPAPAVGIAPAPGGMAVVGRF